MTVHAQAEPVFEVVWPGAPSGIARSANAARLPTLDGKRVGFLWDWLFRGDELFPVLEQQLSDQFRDIEIVGYEIFGNTHGSDEKEMIAALPDVLRAERIDAVISGVGC